jgi:very-short-patch-repair endonuclease
VTPSGRYNVDALWRRQRVAAEGDGSTFHLSAEGWSADLVRQNALHGVGLVVLGFPVRRLRADPVACGRELRALLRPSGVAG